MKRILIIEDNDKDFQSIYAMIIGNMENIDVYPKSVEENRELRKIIKAFFSAQDSKSVPAKAFLDNMKINDYDGLILDYELYPSIKLVTGVQLYKELKLNLKALILTKYTGRKFDIVGEIVNSEGVSDMILVKQKGNLVILSDEQKEEHLKNIEKHLFGLNHTVIDDFSMQIISKLNDYKPKITAAAGNIEREIIDVTQELINKIKNKTITFNEDFYNELKYESDQKYLDILKKLNLLDVV